MIYDNIKWYNNKGYWRNNIHGLLHRYIYTKYNGPIPKGYIVHHDNENKLDNTPKNLIAMTPGEHKRLHKKGNINMLGKHHSEETKDKMSKAAKGHTHNAKLTNLDVKWIKMWLSLGYTGTSIAKAFNVSRPQISRIKTGRSWSTTCQSIREERKR